MNKEMKKILMGSAASCFFLNGCASMDKSLLLGAGMGGSVGAGVGIMAGRNPTGALIGAGVGVIVGAGLGYLGHKDKEDKDAVLKALQGKRKEIVQEPPMLKAPEANCYKVDEKITGEEYFGPQLRCRIERPAVWGLK